MKEKASHSSCHIDWPLDNTYDDTEEMKHGRVVGYHRTWNMLRAHEAHEVEDMRPDPTDHLAVNYTRRHRLSEALPSRATNSAVESPER